MQNGVTAAALQIGGGNSLPHGATIQIWGAQFVVGSAPAPYDPTSTTTTVYASGQPGTPVPSGLSQVYAYDSFGNITENGSFQTSYTANNQMFGYAYDAAGNLLSDQLSDTMTWDAESRLATVGGATYLYDAEGNRVEKQGATVTDTVYFGGRPLARYSGGQWTDLIYGPNGLLAEVPGTQTGAPMYRATDYLGNVVGSLTATGTFVDPIDHTPFGQVFTGNTSDPYLFTGKERDTESGLDYFGARYMSSNMGRFMSPDWSASADPVPYARMDNPQSLNLYAYVGNNPLSRRDGDGHSPCGGSANITINVNSNGTSSMSQTADCPDNSSWMMFAGLIGGGVGHHYIPQSISNGFNNLTQRFSNSITSGSLTDKTVNYYDKLHRAYNDRVAKVLAQYLQDTGKNIKQLTTSDIKAIVQRMKNAGGEIEDFNTRLTTANPGVRSMEEGVEHAAQAVSESGAAKAAEEFIEECEMGAPCIPPI